MKGGPSLNQRVQINGEEIARALAEKFKNFATAQGDAEKSFPDIQNTILEVLSAHGIEIPDKVKQAILEHLPQR